MTPMQATGYDKSSNFKQAVNEQTDLVYSIGLIPFPPSH